MPLKVYVSVGNSLAVRGLGLCPSGATGVPSPKHRFACLGVGFLPLKAKLLDLQICSRRQQRS